MKTQDQRAYVRQYKKTKIKKDPSGKKKKKSKKINHKREKPQKISFSFLF